MLSIHSKKNTIINGSGFQRAIHIFAENVNISGFTIQHGKNQKQLDWNLGIDIHYYRAKNINIYDNIITNISRGIHTHQTSANIKIYNNLIINNYYGIESGFDSKPLNIFNNIIIKNEYGIHSSQSQISLSNNIISNNTIGIYMRGIEGNYTIISNEIRQNKLGIYIDVAKSMIKHNNFINNDKDVECSMSLFIRTIPKYFYYKQNWINNYWDDWEMRIPKVIPCLGTLFVIVFLPVKPFIIYLPIGLFPYLEIDWHPAKVPYDI